MKNFIRILTLIFFASIISFAQSSTDTSADKKIKEIDKKSDFIDENVNGLDDRIEKHNIGKKKRLRDRFIDLDGDGICDERQGGVGIRSRQGEKQGKQGGHKHQGNR